MLSPVRIGTTGWNHEDWIGTFYLPGWSGSPLETYFRSFDTVEIGPKLADELDTMLIEEIASQARQAGNREFNVLMPPSITDDLALRRRPWDLGRGVKEFRRRVVDPLDDHGVLGAVVFRTPPNFAMRGDILSHSKRDTGSKGPNYTYGAVRLREIADHLSILPGDKAVELSHSSWIDEDGNLDGEALDVLKSTDVSLVVVDGPSFPWIEFDHRSHIYIRFIGRNSEAWFRGQGWDGEGVFDYLYSEEELRERIPLIRGMDPAGNRRVRIIFSNWPRCNAPRNVEMMKGLMCQKSARGKSG